MPRSTRHKSSKHSSRDVRDFSDSERDSGVKDRKDSTRESSVRASKELTSGEKRKLDSKENKESFGSGNGEYSEEYTSSKRRKERLDGSANDRWNGRGQDDRGEKKSKPSSESRSTKRRDESVGVYGDGEESGKKNSGKIEGKHRESSRKEGEGERVRDRERKGKEGKIERLVDGEDHHSLTKQVTEKTESFARDQLRSSEMENQFERRIKRNRDGSGDGDKHQDDIGDVNSRRQSSKNDITKDGRSKDEKHKDERYRDKHQKDMDKNNRQRDEKQRDEKDHVHSWSDEKYLRDGKDTTEARQKKSKTQDTDRNREHDDERDDLEYNNYHERDQDHDHNRDRNHDRGRERDPDRDYDCDWDWDRDQDRDIDHDGSHLDDQGARHKDSRGKKRSPDDPDDYNDKKSRGLGASYHDAEKKSLSSGRVEPDRGRSHSHQALRETIVGGSRRRSSPSSSSHGVPDEYRHFKSEDSKYRDGGTKQRSRPNSSQDTTGFSGSSGRASKYRSTEEPTKPDDGYKGEFSAERPSSSKASPIGLVDRSPSSMSLERKYMSRTAVRRSLDIEESGRRSSSSMGARDSSVAEDRSGRDLPLADGSPQADSSFYSRTSQGISSSFVTPPITFRGRVGSPSFLGSLEEDTRVGHGTRYRRNSDPNFARVQGNAWRGPPSWSSPVPNGFISFQHGPPHGGFQTMMPQFSAPPMFGVRPSMDINASGIPYTFPDADQFSGHLRPHGWQNMMDGSGPPHLHGWDGSNGVYRDEPHMYGGPNWDQNRHHVNGRGWESGGDAWKGQNGDVNMDLPPMSQEEDLPMRSMVDDVHTGQLGQKSQYENNHGTVKPTEMASIVTSPSKEMSKSSPKVTREKSSDTTNEDDVTWFCRAYLSKLDISTELTDPELYGQYMTLLNREQNGTAGRDINMLVSLQDDGRAIFKSSSSFLGLKLLPVADDSVFQRAMDFYKKQRVNMRALENVCGGPSDIISASNLGKMEEPGNICNVEMVEEPNSILETSMEDAPDQEKAETVAAAVPKDKLEEPVLIYDSATLEVPYQEKAEAAAVYAEDNLEERASTPSQVVQDQVTHILPNKKLEVLGDGSPVEPVQNLSREGVDGITCEEEDRKDTRGDFMVTSDNASCATPVLVTDSKGKKEVSKGEASGDAVRCPLPLFLSDGSPNASGALLPGSNESVILNRIHHSPESTH